ncbi:MAG: hypothetical protein JSU87_01425 [Gemmatimonadota bacterium]|nr:MAG: hypothetical protein JSU87_01425 [Gemmatimonadota bacterium]
MRVLPAALLVLGFFSQTVGTAHGQSALRRTAAIQPVGLARKGDLLLGVGAAYESNVSRPLVAVFGDLGHLGALKLAWAVADYVLLEVEGDLLRVLTVDSMGTPPINPRPEVFNGKSTAAGDFSVAFSFLILGDGDGLGVGGRLKVDLPNSNQKDGIGTNTTNVHLSLLGSYGRGPFQFTGNVGVGILEVPLESFRQNDVIVYSAEMLVSPLADVRLRLLGGVDGRASTRNKVPIGTEDLGEAYLGLDFRFGDWLIDAAAGLGYAGNSPDWKVEGGLAFLING